MIQLLNIHSIGYVANNNPLRASRGGSEFEGILPTPTWQEEIVKRNADVSQTVSEMQNVIRKSAWQTSKLAKLLLGKDLYTTGKKIWEFLFYHILYKEDDKGKEQLRTPALSWYLRTKRGIDCDDFSIFASTILYNLGIPHYLRIARYAGKDYFQHVYVVIPQTGKKYITIDAVLDEYDTEKQTVETKDYLVMNTNNLSGIDVAVLSGIEDDTLKEISGILEGLDFDKIQELEGLEGLDNTDELEGLEGEDGEVILGSIYNHMRRTREVVKRSPHLISTVEDPQMFGDMLDYGLKYWNTDKQDEALGILAEKEDEINTMQGLNGLAEGSEETQLYYGVEGMGGVSVLGRIKVKKQFFNNIKKTVAKVKQNVKKTAQRTGSKIKVATKNAGQKAKKVAKKVGKFLIKTNPVTVAARAGMLAAMKTNFLKIASKLKWGYLTEAEAKEQGFDMAEWAKSKTSLTKAENMFVNVLKGNPQAFKKAILTGRAGGLSGINEELGVVAAAATGASLTAAMPFIKKLVELVKMINPAKLVRKVKANKLAKKQKQADIMPEADEDSRSAQPDSPPQDEGGNEAITEESNDIPSEEREKPSSENEAEENNDSSSESTKSEEQSEPTSSAGLPATTSQNLPVAKQGDVSSGEVNPVMKVVNWVKENPGKSALITGLGLVLFLGAKSNSPNKSASSGMGKAGKGKRKKGKNKKNPPKAISGTPKKTPKPKYKNKTGKRKGKSGGLKRITL